MDNYELLKERKKQFDTANEQLRPFSTDELFMTRKDESELVKCQWPLLKQGKLTL